jgi:hypothetical protein
MKSVKKYGCDLYASITASLKWSLLVHVHYLHNVTYLPHTRYTYSPVSMQKNTNKEGCHCSTHSLHLLQPLQLLDIPNRPPFVEVIAVACTDLAFYCFTLRANKVRDSINRVIASNWRRTFALLQTRPGWGPSNRDDTRPKSFNQAVRQKKAPCLIL